MATEQPAREKSTILADEDDPWTGPVRYRAEYHDDWDGCIEGPEPSHQHSKFTVSSQPGVLEVIRRWRCVSGVKALDTPRKELPQRAAGRPGPSRIRIHSPRLINALRAVVQYYPGQELTGETVEFEEPFRFLVHHRKELERYKFNHPPQHDETYRTLCNEEIDVLLGELEKLMGKAIRAEEERHKNGLATFENLWMIFKPGEKLFLKDLEVDRVMSFLLSEIRGGTVQGKEQRYRLSLWNVRYDGLRFRRDKDPRIVIKPFEGEKEIIGLRVYPQSYHKDSEEDLRAHEGRSLAQQMIVRGKKYWDLRKPCLKEFHGACIAPKRLPKIEGRVMVDFLSWATELVSPHSSLRRELRGDFKEAESDSDSDSGNRNAHDSDSDADLPRRARKRTLRLRQQDSRESMNSRGCECEECAKVGAVKKVKATYRHYDDVDPNGDPPNQDHFFSLCDRDVLAFSLKDRAFVILDIDNIRDPTFDSTLFENLVLPKLIKDTITTLAVDNLSKTREKSGEIFSADFIHGKGEGQVFLLHGKPGVGKTCTAECVAEMTKRPLLAITSGDLGTRAQVVERNLSKFFRLGETWDAIVLIDEADIYFEERSINDIERNGIVSVLLRALEYYRGTLFLTTNRLGVFDEAFMSRVHVSLGFPDLTDEDRELIWRNNFSRLTSNTNIQVSKAAITYLGSSEVAGLKWNGRHIRNAFQTVVALAQADSARGGEEPKITIERIRDVVMLSKEFNKYLQDLNKNLDLDQVARRKGYRA